MSLPRLRAALLMATLPGMALAGDELPLEGVLRSLQPGDVACHVEIDTASGARSEMANFSVCEQGESWIGQRVRFAWTEANVLAADCQGDMDCGRSDTVTLIDRMMREPAEAACAPGEVTAFSCAVGGKQVAVCHSADAAAGTGWLQYRFGRPGAAAEMLWPDYPADPVLSAEGRVESYSGGGASWLRFRRSDYAYVVYTGIGRWGEDGETREQAGVVVERRGVAIADLRCTGPVTSELGPDWFERLGVEAVEEAEFIIPGV